MWSAEWQRKGGRIRKKEGRISLSKRLRALFLANRLGALSCFANRLLRLLKSRRNSGLSTITVYDGIGSVGKEETM